MEDTKSFWQSRSVIGSIVTIVALVGSFRGVPLDGSSQAQLTDMLVQCIALIGSGVALWGRVVATKKIG